MTTALVLIDLMPRIVGLPLEPYSGEDVLRRCRQLATAARARGDVVALVRVDRPGVDEQPPGSDLVEGLAEPGDVLVVKHAVGAFHRTDLHDRLQARGVTSLVLAGLVTTMGVESTARSASDLDYELELVEDAMSGLAADEHEMAVRRTFPRFGRVRTTADYL